MGTPSQIRCEHCNTAHLGFLCPRRAETADRFSHSRVERAYPRGQALFHAGESASSLFVIRSGRVRVFSRWRDGEEQVLRLLGPGEILGYRAVLAREPYNASAEAVVDTRACVVPAETVCEMLREDPDLAMQMLEKLSRELRLSEELMMELVHRPVGQRVARLLLTLVETGAAELPDCAISAREMSRRDMARMVGTTPETMSRVLRRLALRGVLSVTRERVLIQDMDRLRRAAGEHSATT